MKADLPKPGVFVVAVSGGVDSMVLIDLLKKAYKSKDYKLIVAHLDHGIRADSKLDRELVEEVAKSHNLPFVYHEAELGSGTSEEAARKARYEFLDSVKSSANADYIVMAHHQDDLIETAVINMLRGTGRKGLSSLASSGSRLRPLLSYTKKDILSYAKANNLVWREDSTNLDDSYLRNYIRQRLMVNMNDSARSQLTALINNTASINNQLDGLLKLLLAQHSIKGEVDRVWFNQLPHSVAKEILATWLRKNDIRDFDRNGLERLVVAAKVGRVNKKFPLHKNRELLVKKDRLALIRSER